MAGEALPKFTTGAPTSTGDHDHVEPNDVLSFSMAPCSPASAFVNLFKCVEPPLLWMPLSSADSRNGTAVSHRAAPEPSGAAPACLSDGMAPTLGPRALQAPRAAEGGLCSGRLAGEPGRRDACRHSTADPPTVQSRFGGSTGATGPAPALPNAGRLAGAKAGGSAAMTRLRPSNARSMCAKPSPSPSPASSRPPHKDLAGHPSAWASVCPPAPQS